MRRAPTSDPLLTLAEVCDELGFARTTIRQMITRGELTAVRRGQRGRLRIARSSVDAWRREHQVQPAHPRPEPRPGRPAPPPRLAAPMTPEECRQRAYELTVRRRRRAS